MKKILSIWKLGIIPCVVFILGLLMRKAAGPFWLGINSDPSYVYLFDSFRILDGKVPTIVEHPGTTIQMFGAVVIKALNLTRDNQQILIDLITRPEFYLVILNLLLLIFFVSVCWVTGIYAYRKSKNYLFAIFIQSGSLQYLVVKSFIQKKAVLPVIANFSPETVLIVINQLYILCLLRLFFDFIPKGRKSHFFDLTAMSFGLVCALGIITKLTFVPMALLPFLLLQGMKRKAGFLFSLGTFMLLLTLPIAPRYSKLIEWLTSLSTHTGIYGSGNKGFIAWNTVGSNLWKLVQWYPVFGGVLAISAVSALSVLFYRKDSLAVEKKRIGLFIGVILVTAMSQVAIVVKHLGPHYVVPALSFEGLLLGLIYLLFKQQKISKGVSWAGIFLIVFQSVCVFYYYGQVKALSSSLISFSQEVHARSDDSMIVPFYRASSKEMALFFGYRQYVPYGEVLKTVYPHAYFLQEGSHRFFDFTGEVPFLKIKEMHPDVLLYGSQDPVGRFVKVERIDSVNGDENLYRVITVASDQAIALYFMSQKLASEGKIKEAMAFALRSKSLGFPDIESYILQLKYVYDHQVSSR